MPDRLRPELPAGQSEPQNTISSFGLKRNWAIKACLADKKNKEYMNLIIIAKNPFLWDSLRKKVFTSPKMYSNIIWNDYE